MDDGHSRQDTFAQPAEGEYVLSLKDLFRVVWRRLWIVALVAIVLGGAAFGYSISQASVYQASLQMLIGQSGGVSDTPSDALALQQLTQTMSQAANSRPIAEDVIAQLELDMTPEELLGGLEVEPDPESQFIWVHYNDTDPEMAARIANAIGGVFSDRIAEVSPEASDITATVWSEADVSENPVSPAPARNAALAIAFGGFLGLALVFLLEYLDDSWNSPEEAEEISGVPTFGVIPQFVQPTGKKALSGGKRTPPSSPSAAYSRGVSRAVEPYKSEYRSIAQDGRVLWPFGLVLVDADGKIEESNPALQQMLGYTADEMKGEDFARFAAHPDAAESHDGIHKGLMEGGSEQYQTEKRCVRKDGQILWTRLTVSLMRDPDGEARFSLCMVDDVTGRKQLEGELKLSRESRIHSEKRLASIVENSPLAIQTFTEDGFALLANEAWRDFWGWGGRSAEGVNVLEDEGVRDAGLKPYIEKSIAAKEAVKTPPLRREERWMQASIHPILNGGGSVVEMLLAVEDITTSQISRENESKLESLEAALDRMEQELDKAGEDRDRSRRDLEEAVAERDRLEKSLKESQDRFRSIIQYATDTTSSEKGDGERGGRDGPL